MLKKISAIVLALLFLPSATNADFNDIRWYKVYFSGFEIGDLVIAVNKQQNTYRINTKIRSKNIARAATKYWCNAESIIKENIQGNIKSYFPQSFATSFNLRKKVRDINISYNDKGEIVKYSNTPPENPGKRPPVVRELTNNSLDPLAVALVVREKIRQHRNDKTLDNGNINFVLPLYDGRRKSELLFRLHGRTNEKIMGRNTRVIHISFETKPIAGYTTREIEELPKHNPKINIYVSDDELLLPLKGDGETRIGFASGSLYKICKTPKECEI